MADETLTAERLDELERLANEATPGPWAGSKSTSFYQDGMIITLGEGVGGGCIARINYDHQTGDHDPDADTDFIAASRTALPALVARVRELEKIVQEYRNLAKFRGSELERQMRAAGLFR